MDHRKTLIVDTFLKAVTRRSSNEQRLQSGLFLRQQFQNALKKGLVPMHPRFEWLRRSSRTMMELLIAMAKDYDKANPTGSDKASMADLLDICQMTQGHIAGICNAGVLDPDAVELPPYEEVQPEITITPASPTDTITVSRDEEQSDVLDGADEDEEDGEEEP